MADCDQAAVHELVQASFDEQEINSLIHFCLFVWL